MARRKTLYGAYALEKFELPVEVRTQLRHALDRHTARSTRRAERARETALQKRQDQWSRLKTPQAEAPSPAFPPRPPDTDDRVYIEGFAVGKDGLSGSERRSSDPDELSRNKKAAARLAEVGPWRAALRLPANWRDALATLRARFPNFAEVVDTMRRWLVMSEREFAGNRVITLPPLLLLGQPGIGKTMFVEAFADALRLPLHRVDMASAQTSSRLSGSDEYWSNSKPGLLFEILAFSEHGGVANSIVLLDEIDKASVDSRYDPLGPLYTLLERRTAAAFTDLAFPRTRLDASHVLFIGTANDASPVPTPILSRMRQFEVPGLDPEGSLIVVRHLAAQVARSLGLEATTPSATVLASLLGLSPRTVRQVLQEAFGRALEAGRTELLPDDIVAPRQHGSGGRIGFVQEGQR